MPATLQYAHKKNQNICLRFHLEHTQKMGRQNKCTVKNCVERKTEKMKKKKTLRGTDEAAIL